MPGSRNTRSKGQCAEDLAKAFLEARGLKIVARNASAAGAEIDIIAQLPPDGSGSPFNCIFVEVRSRTSQSLGHPLETVDRKKQRRIIRAATSWLISQGLWEKVAVRFDVVGIVSEEHTNQVKYAEDRRFDGEQSRITSEIHTINGERVLLVWIPDAFSLF